MDVLALSPAEAPSADAVPARILCVDDEPGVLSALRRSLRHRDLHVLTAGGGPEALAALEQGPVDVVVSDMRMPEMSGAELLGHVRERWPETSRILLTGHADAESTIAAINQGQVLRYLRKPWDDELLHGAVLEGVDLARRQRAIAVCDAHRVRCEDEALRLRDEVRSLLEEHGAAGRRHDGERRRRFLQAVNALASVIQIRSLSLHSHGRRVAVLATQLAQALGMSSDEVLHVHAAALVHDIGMIGLDDARMAHPRRLQGAERAVHDGHARLSSIVLATLDELAPLVPIVEAHHERFDGTGGPAGLAANGIPLGARILAVADAVDEFEQGHGDAVPLADQALLRRIRQGSGTAFDERIVEAYVARVHARRR